MNREDAPLRVVNGMSTQGSSMITVAARENVCLSPGRPETLLFDEEVVSWLIPNKGLRISPLCIPSLPEPKRVITPSLATWEKAVSARIYFENLYFPLLRHPPSREQRRLAIEKDMLSMDLSDPRKDELRAHWRQKETEYIREQRRKVDINAFVKLKTIGHGEFAAFTVVFKHPELLRDRCVWCRFSRSRTNDWQVVRHETGACYFTRVTSFFSIAIRHQEKPTLVIRLIYRKFG